jgi:hypothetical protein
MIEAMHRPERVYQFAFVVDDLETAARAWAQLGAGPFYLFEDFEFAGMLHPSGVSSPRLSILLGYSGDVMLELMRVDEDPTGLFAGAARDTAHHVALLVDDIDRYLDARALRPRLAMHALFPTGTPIALVDTRPQTGLFTELVTLDDAVRGMIAQMRSEAAQFDGERLLRTFA